MRAKQVLDTCTSINGNHITMLFEHTMMILNGSCPLHYFLKKLVEKISFFKTIIQRGSAVVIHSCCHMWEEGLFVFSCQLVGRGGGIHFMEGPGNVKQTKCVILMLIPK